MLQKSQMDLRDSYTLGLCVWTYIIDRRHEEQAASNVVRLKVPGARISNEIAAVAKQTSPEEFARYAIEYIDSVRDMPGYILPSEEQIAALAALKSKHKHN